MTPSYNYKKYTGRDAQQVELGTLCIQCRLLIQYTSNFNEPQHAQTNSTPFGRISFPNDAVINEK